MIRRILLLLAMAGIYLAIQRSMRTQMERDENHSAEAQWANEGGANSPVTL
jgi:hypothetical protein